MNRDDDRFAHEETAADRWVGALLAHRRLDAPARVDALVSRATGRVRGEAEAHVAEGGPTPGCPVHRAR